MNTKNSVSQITTTPFPASRKVYVKGEIHPDLWVAMREIQLSEQAKEPDFWVYDTSGAYTDTSKKIDINKGLEELRRKWILARGDVEEYAGREVKPEDN